MSAANLEIWLEVPVRNHLNLIYIFKFRCKFIFLQMQIIKFDQT